MKIFFNLDFQKRWGTFSIYEKFEHLIIFSADSHHRSYRGGGYLTGDSDYKTLDKQISDLESTIQGKHDIGSKFTDLRDRIAPFLKRQKEHERR
ncbi:hypothetical protein [Tunturibacter empetritectus]|uniref:Uncharacterized protein n=1 Tax=Tunturiibacter lichenicola TaxID=2051959 RepID=A0A7W8J675_9BACT|nr:hypothetical protein [Edaphobacter lichenicola]MBB5343387.1 hypothetical protein [Edaphobacter lichenicola]